MSFSILFRTDLNSISISFSRRGEPPRTPLLGEKDVPIVFESVQFFLRIWTRNLRFYIDFPQKTHQNTAIFEGFSFSYFRFRKPAVRTVRTTTILRAFVSRNDV